MYMCDEVPDGLGTKVVDVTTILTPTVDSVFYTHVGATPHNPYVKGNFLYLAAYQDGLYIYDISTPSIPVLRGFFDTHPQNGTSYPSPAYAGCWAAYTDLPSGTLLASDMQYGLFSLDASLITGLHNTATIGQSMLVYPNPVHDVLKIRMMNGNEERVTIEMTDALGRTVKEMKNIFSTAGEIQLQVDHLSAGLYMVKVRTADRSFVKRVNVVR